MESERTELEYKAAEWITIKVPKRELESMKNLCHWLDGFKEAGKARVVGHFELVTFLRSMREIKIRRSGDDE